MKLKILIVFFLLNSSLAQASVGGGVGEGTVDHPVRNYYPKEEINEIREVYPPLLNFLPIGRKKALKKEIYLPLPLGTALNFVYLNQGLEFKNPRIGGSNSNISDIEINDTRDKRVGITARAGFWLFRYLNIYMTGGYAWGEAEGKLTFKTTTPPDTKSFDIKLEYEGGQVGVGGTFAIGIKRFFVVFDGNYNWLFLDVGDETVKAYSLSPKFGMMFPSKKMGTGAFYVGAMFLDFTMAFQSKLPQNNTSFKIYGTPEKNWNFIFGGSWEFNPRWSVFTEAGVGERKQFVLGGGFRF